MPGSTTSITQTVNGSCHCGFIKYTGKIPIPAPPEKITASRCNCTICHKSGFTGLSLGSKENFTLLSPSSLSEVPDYQWQSKDIHRYFCPKCGVQVLGEGKYVFGEQEVPFFSLNALTLDLEGLSGEEKEAMDMRNWRIQYWDGRHDNWQAGAKEVPWEGGCI